MSPPNPTKMLGSKDYLFEISKGNVPGYELVGIVSNRADIGTSFQDVWGGPGAFVYPVVAETWEAFSDSANDTIAGTGAQKLTISTLDINRVPQGLTTINMNGTTPVTFPGTHFRLKNAIPTQFGKVGTDGVNDGNITIRSTGSGNLVRAIIGLELVSGEGTNGDFNSMFTVPAGKEAFWVQSSGFIQKGEDGKVRPRFQIGGAGPFFVGGVSTTYQSHFIFPFKSDLRLPEKSEILFQAKATNIGTFGTFVMEFVLVDSTLLSPVVSAWNFQL